MTGILGFTQSPFSLFSELYYTNPVFQAVWSILHRLAMPCNLQHQLLFSSCLGCRRMFSPYQPTKNPIHLKVLFTRFYSFTKPFLVTKASKDSVSFCLTVLRSHCMNCTMRIICMRGQGILKGKDHALFLSTVAGKVNFVR